VSARERQGGRTRPERARSPAAGARPVAEPGAPAPVPPGAPPLWRDPWALAPALAVVPLLALCWGAPLGEPVAEDFDFLRRSLFRGTGSLFDGGGSTAFWRPLAHQLYYAALGPLIVTHPRVVAALHALLLAAGSLFVFRALRPYLGGRGAALAATFPMFSESTRTLVAWPSQFVDVGLYFFSAVALDATARRRLRPALAATALALLCKELAVVPALLLPWFPDQRSRDERRRWALAFGLLLLVWGATYIAVRHAAGLALPHGLEQQAASPFQRVAWAFTATLRALISLPLARTPRDGIAYLVAIGFPVATLLGDVLARPLRGPRGLRPPPLRANRAWIGWGAGWFAAATLALTPIYPLWQPNRSHFAGAGVGVLAGAACVWLPPLAEGLLIGRGALLLAAPPAATTISEDAPQSGAFMDFAQLSRLERFMAATRTALAADYRHVAPHAHLIEMNLPRGLIYAFGGDRAVQVWYRDSTLAMVDFTRVASDTTLSMIAGVQFQPRAQPQVVLLSPAAMRAQDTAYRHLRGQRWEAAIAACDHADSLAPGARYAVFHGNNAGYRSLALLELQRVDEAAAQATRAVSGDPDDPNGWRVQATTHAMAGQFDAALRDVAQLERVAPDNASVARLRASITAARDAAARQ